ncbi:MAG: hypothetical protein L6R42_005936 [Xanthoria sp. 1 TBL-2021]|nr:MAG: hypothetical protein L6R42_005936 [Xanthoria sp. 1 TBL-2021]
MSVSPHDERERLLPRNDPSTEEDHGTRAHSHHLYWKQSVAALKDFRSRPSTPILCCTFILFFLISFSKHVIEVPTIRLFELAACHQHYAHVQGAVGHDGDTDNRLCKVPDVQNELSTLTGWKFGLDAVYVLVISPSHWLDTCLQDGELDRPGLFLAIYYGSVAGKYGRKPVLLLFSTGMLLSLGWIVLICWLDGRVPIRLVWLSSLFTFIGGGQRVAKAMLFTIVSDAVDTSHRTSYLSFLASIPHITTLIAPPLSAVFMRISIWLPFEAAIGALTLTYILILLMPESSKLTPPSDPITTNTTSSHLPHDRQPLLSPRSSSNRITAETPPTWYTEIHHLLHTPSLRLSLTIFLSAPTALVAKSFVYQHASESFGWEMSSTTWLRVSQALGASLVTLFALPILNSLVHPLTLHQARKFDLAVLRASLLVAAIGFAVLWQAKASWMLVLALFICGLSEAIQPANQGLATSFVARELNARLFTTVAVVETVGKLAGGPAQSALFSIGRREGRGSLGVNFLASSGIFLVLLLLAVLVRVRR